MDGYLLDKQAKRKHVVLPVLNKRKAKVFDAGKTSAGITHLAFHGNSTSDAVSQKTLGHTLSRHIAHLHSIV